MDITEEMMTGFTQKLMVELRCEEEAIKKVMFNKNVVENVEVGNGNKESTYRNRKTSIRTVLAGKCQVIDVGKFPATKSKVVYGVLLPEFAK